MLGPSLEGQRVSLEPLRPDHLPRFLDWFADPRVTAYLKRDVGRSMKDEEEFFERVRTSNTEVVWAVIAGGTHVGSTGIHQIDWQHRRGTTGIVIGERTMWGKGIASEAMQLRTRYAFENLNLEKLMSFAWAENGASRRALEKTGYREAGLFRHHLYRHGRWHDLWAGELLRSDWQPAPTE